MNQGSALMGQISRAQGRNSLHSSAGPVEKGNREQSTVEGGEHPTGPNCLAFVLSVQEIEP